MTDTVEAHVSRRASLSERRALSDRLLRYVGLSISRSATGYVFAWDARKSRTLAATLLGCFLGLCFILFVAVILNFPLGGPFSTIDEHLQYYQVARNYNAHGFLKSALLPDLSTAADAAGHPYLYNHQPPGPQIFIALQMRLFGENYRLIRLVFAAVFFAGLICFVRFAMLLEDGARYVMLLSPLLIAPGTVLNLIDHPGKSAFPFVAFFPLIALHAYHSGRSRLWFAAAAFVVFVGSMYLMYQHLFMILAFWIAGMVLGFLAIERREMALFVGLAAIAIVLHLLQSVLVLGWSTFLEEFTMTLSNRMFGTPGREAIVDFFRVHGLVLFGQEPVDLTRWRMALWRELHFPAREVCALAVGAAILVGMATELRTAGAHTITASAVFVRWLKTLGRALLWVTGTVLVPYLMFPAFATVYSLGGATEFFVAILVALGLSVTFRSVSRMAAPQACRTLLVIGLLAFIAMAAYVQTLDFSIKAKKIAQWIRRPNVHNGLVWMQGNLHGRVAMTNVDPTVVGFFTQEVVFGGCHQPAVGKTGIDPSACRVNFIRPGSGFQAAPTVYVWVASGQAFCAVDDCIHRSDIEGRYVKLFDNDVVAAYDLTKPL